MTDKESLILAQSISPSIDRSYRSWRRLPSVLWASQVTMLPSSRGYQCILFVLNRYDKRVFLEIGEHTTLLLKGPLHLRLLVLLQTAL